MVDTPKKRRFRSFFTKKPKDYNLSYTKREQAVLDELAKLPSGSQVEVELRARLDAAKAKAAAQESPRKDMKQLLSDAKKAVSRMGDVAPEMAVSSATVTPEMIDKMDVGAAEKLVVAHRSAIVTAYHAARTDLAALKTEVKKYDLSIESPSLALEATLEQAERDDRAFATNPLMTTAQLLDKQAAADLIDGPTFDSGVETLGEDITAHMAVVQGHVDDLKRDIAAAMGDPGTLQALAATAVEAEQVAKDKAAFEQRLREIDKLVMELEGWDHPNAGAYRQSVNIQQSSEPADYTRELAVLDGLKAEIENAKRMHQRAYEEKAAAVKEKFNQVKATLDLLFMNSALEGAVGVYVDAMYDQFRDELNAVKLLIGNGANEASLGAADKMLDKLSVRAQDFGDNFDAVGNVHFYQWECDSTLAKKKYGKVCPDMQQRLKTKVDDLIASSGKLDPSVAIGKFKAVHTEIKGSQADSYVSKAEARIVWLKAFAAKAKTAEGELAKMLKAMKNMVPDKNNKDFFSKYNGPLAADLTQARELAGKELQAGMDLADQKVDAVIAKTAQAIAALAKAADARTPEENELCMDVVTGQSAAVTLAQEQARDMATFKVEYAQHKNRMDIADLHIETKPHLSGEANAIRQLLKKAKELMENTHNLEQARGIMEAADARREKLLIDARRPPTELATMAREWNSATGTMTQAFKTIQTNAIAAVAAAQDNELTAAAGGIEDTLKTAAKFLTDEKFLEEMNFYISDQISPKDLRRQREKTLNKIKLLKDYLSNDPVLRSAQANPFGVKSVIGPVYAALQRIEHKVMVSG